MNALTWTCHGCGRERPDHLIGVYKARPRLGVVDVQVNLRYCIDQAACLEAVKARAQELLNVWEVEPA